jgi:hypothetical protein
MFKKFIQKIRNLKIGIKFIIISIFLNLPIIIFLNEINTFDGRDSEIFLIFNWVSLFSILILYKIFWGSFQKDNKDA